MRKIYLLVVFSLLTLSISRAQFTALSGPPGGHVKDIERTGGGTLYSLVGPTLYQSTNSGTSWQKTTITTPASGISFEDLVIGPNGKLYGLTYSELYTSTDATNWTKVSTTSFYGVYKLKRFGPDGFLVASGWNGVWVSIDDGITFTQILIDGLYDDYKVTFNTAGDMFVGTSTGIKRYLYPGTAGTFDAANWTTVYPITNIYHINLGVDGSNNVYAEVAYNNSNIYTRLLTRSTAANNGGAGTWSPFPQTTISTNDWNGFWALNASTLYYFNRGNGGKIYSNSNLATIDYPLTANTINNSTYVVVTSTAGAKVGDVVAGTGIPVGSYITDILSATELYISNNCTADGIGVTVTGTTINPWSVSDSPSRVYGSSEISVAFESGTTFYVGSDGSGIFKTTNAGVGFSFNSAGLYAGNGNDVAVANITGNIIYINNYSTRGYWTSTDNGTSWSFVSLNYYVRKVLKLADGTLLLYGDKVFRSTDNGVSFTEVASTGYVVDLEPDPNNTATPNSNVVYYSDNINLYTSTDSGLTWNSVAIPAPVPAFPVNSYIRHLTIGTAGDVFILRSVYNSTTSMDEWSLYKFGAGATTLIPNAPWVNELYWGANNLFIQSGKLYVTSYNAFYTTVDDGANWVTNGFSGSYVFPISKGGFDGIAVSRGGTLYISQTDGKTFNSNQLPNTNSTITNMVLDNSGNFVASALASAALKFTGNLLVDPATIPSPIEFTWEPTNGPYGGPTEYLDKDNSNNVYTYSWRGIYKANLAVTSWTKVNTPPQYNQLNSMAVSGNTLYGLVWDKLFTSADGGTNWAVVSNSENINSRNRLIVSPNGNIVMISEGTKIYISTDGGVTFGSPKITAGTNEYFYDDRIFMASSTNAIFVDFYNYNNGVVTLKRTADAGANWSDVTMPVNVNSFNRLSADANGNIYGVTWNDIFKSSDNGSTWTSIKGDLNTGWWYESKVYTSPDNTLYFLVNGNSGAKILKKSANGGANWTDVGNIGSEIAFDIEWVGTKMVAATFAGAIASTDDGATFTDISSGITNVIDGKILVGSATRLTVASADFSFSTENSGTNWSKLTQRFRYFFDHPDGSTIAMSTNNNAAFKSTDGGVTWTPYFTANIGGINKYFTADGTNHYVMVYNELYYSNNLTTWTKLNVSGMPPSDKRNFVDISADNNGLIYCIIDSYITNKREAYQILFGSGILLNQVTNPQTLFYKDGKTYLFGQEGTLASTTNGSIWEKKAAPNGYKFSIEAKDYFFVYQWGGLLWLSRDLGQSWQNVGLSNTSRDFNDVALNELDGYAYATINGSPVRRSDKIIIPDDATNPLLESFSPTSNATGVSIKPQLTITFDEGVVPQATKTIRILDVANQITPVETILVTDGVQSGKSFTFTTTNFLNFNTQYFVVVDAGAYKDIFGNSYDGLLNNTAWRFTTKTTPTVASTLPANSSTGVVVTPNFSITFSEPMTGAAGKNVYVYETASPSTPVATISATTPAPQFATILPVGSAADQVVTLTFDATFGGKELMGATKVYAHAGVVTSDANGTNWAYYIGNWGQDDGIGQMTAVPGETDKWRITFGPTLREYFQVPAVANIYRLALVFRNANGNTKAIPPGTVPTGHFVGINDDYYIDLAQTVQTCAGFVTKEGSKLVISGCDNLNYQTQYHIKFDPLALVTPEGLPISLATANTDWAFTTRNAPTASSTTPANTATNVLINTNLELTFSEAVTLIGTNKLYVTNTAVPGTPVATINLSDANVVGNTATFTLPNELAYSTTYSITIDANSFRSVSDNGVFSLFTSTGWQFSTIAPPDTQAPQIAYTPDNFVEGSQNKTISTTITDNVEVTGAQIVYRSITTDANPTTSNLTLNSGKYDIVLPDAAFGKMGLEFYFTATDAAGNAARSPQAGNHYIRVAGPPEGATFPSGLLGTGGELAGWKIITIPNLAGSTPISTVFSELGDADNTKWRMIRYKDDNSDWDQYPTNFSSFKQGDGYFINVKTPPSTGVRIEGTVAPSNNKTSLFPLTLKPGWNQIGNPYTFPMKWSEVLAANTNTSTVTTCKTFSNGSYISGDQIAAYEGAFILNTGTIAVNISVPIVTSLSGGRVASDSQPEPKQELYDIGQEEWIVPISIKAGEIENLFGGVGMRNGASLSVDEFDDFNPPPIAEYVEMSFPHPEHFIKKSTRDVVPVQQEYKWEFTIDTNLDEPFELRWDNTKFGDNEKELFLFDTNNGTLVDMRKQDIYRSANGKSTKFELHFGENLEGKIMPNQIFLGDAYPSPGSGDISIPFTLPENQTSFKVGLDIFDQLGRKITNLVDQSLPSGFYTSIWESNKAYLNDGIYVYKLTVVNGRKVENYTKKIILQK